MRRKVSLFQKRLLSVIFIFFLLIGSMPGFVFAGGTAENSAIGSISNVTFCRALSGDLNYLDFDFDAEKTEYEIILPDNKFLCRMNLTFDSSKLENLYYQAWSDPTNISVKKGPMMWQNMQINLMPLINMNVKVGNAATYYLKAGQYDEETKSFDEENSVTYQFNFKRSLSLKNIEISSETQGEQIGLDMTEGQYQYAIMASEISDTISITPTLYTTNNTKYVIDGKEYSSGETASVQLKTNEKNQKYFDLTLKCAEENENVVPKTYTFVVENQDYTPIVSQKSEKEVICEKDEKVTLSVGAESPAGVEGTLSYQWYSTKNISNDKRGNLISGAVTDSYNPSTEYADTTYYFCKVVNTVNGIKYSTYSDYFKVVVNGSYATKPVITKNPESVSCVQGKEVKLSVTAQTQDKGANICYQWYEENSSGDIKLENETESTLIVPTDEIGEKTYYCVITAKFYETGIESEEVRTGAATVTVTSIPGTDTLTGNGTEENPYQINNVSDLVSLKAIIDSGYSLQGKFIQLTDDITLPEDWTPIGCLKDPDDLQETNFGINVNPFMGTFDGDGHTITIPEGKSGFPRCTTHHD